MKLVGETLRPRPMIGTILLFLSGGAATESFKILSGIFRARVYFECLFQCTNCFIGLLVTQIGFSQHYKTNVVLWSCSCIFFQKSRSPGVVLLLPRQNSSFFL